MHYLKSLIPMTFLLFVTDEVMSCEDIPKEVKNFIWERDRCEHFLGEDYEPRENEDAVWINRRKHVYDSVVLYCSGTERKLTILKKRFKDNQKVNDLLINYEECKDETCD